MYFFNNLVKIGLWSLSNSDFPGGPELLIIGLLFLIVPFVMAYWVYTDVEKRGNDKAALWAIAVGVFTFLTFFGGILALVVYIWDRN